MSNTRYAPEGAPLSQTRYMSSPEYAELRGISGMAVLAKASLLGICRKRSLLFFLQALSLKPGGLKRVVKDLLEMFPQQVGTPTMLRLGMRPGQVYSADNAARVEWELNGYPSADMPAWMPDLDEADQFAEFLAKSKARRSADRSADGFKRSCQVKAEAHLDQFIIDLCVNPEVEFPVPDLGDDLEDFDREKTKEQYPQLWDTSFRTAEVAVFKDIIGALYEYQKRYTKKAPNSFVVTSIAQTTFEMLDYGLETGKMVILEGNSRLGKTTAAETWCDRHLGDARYVSLSGITNRTSFFRALARVLGLASTYTRKASEMQARVEDFLQRSGLALIIDEAHYLWPQSERIYMRPELVDWVNTALCNHCVPVALISTPQFAHRKRQVEKQTGWTSEQFTGRIKRYQRLPEAPSRSDLEAVTRKLLPEGDKASIQYIVGYALVSKRYMPAVCDAVDDARLIAKRAGRDKVTFEDVVKAVDDYRIPSDMAMAGAFSESVSQKRALPRARGKTNSEPLQRALKPVASDLATSGGARCVEKALKPALQPAGKQRDPAPVTVPSVGNTVRNRPSGVAIAGRSIQPLAPAQVDPDLVTV